MSVPRPPKKIRSIPSNAEGETHFSKEIVNVENEYAITKKLLGELKNDNIESRFNKERYFDLINTDFVIGHYCCNIMKKKPLNETSKHAIVGTMADESDMRLQGWLKTGCNAWGEKKGLSKPLSFWTEQDVLLYIKKEKLEVASVYGDLVYVDKVGLPYTDTLLTMDFDYAGCKLKFTGCQRTGCIFCGFGCHLDKQNGGESRFVRLKRTHRKLYDYCMGGGEYNEQGLWQPSKTGLGMAHCIDILNKLYSKNGKKFIEY